MADRLHLSPRHRSILERLLQEHLPDVEAWAYGSRVKGLGQDARDLDLALRAPGLKEVPADRLADFKNSVRESPIPFLVEARDWARLPARSQREIAWDHVPLNDGARSRPVDGPQDVQFAMLLAEPVRNGLYKTKQFHGRGAKVVNMGELFAHPRLRDIPMRRVELTDSEKARFCVRPGDLLFARRSLVAEGAGKCCVVLETPEPTAFESSIIRARPNAAKADSLFLYYYFNSPTGLHSLDTIRRQVAVAGITGTDLANLDIRLPPVAEQRRIANILGALDDKIELNRRMNETLEAMARALFKSWFVDFEPVRAKTTRRDCPLPPNVSNLFPSRITSSDHGDVPAGWHTYMLDELVEHHTESIAPSATPNVEFEHFSIPAYDAGQTPKLEIGANIKSNKTVVPHDSVLLSKLNPEIPRVWVPGESTGPRQVASTEFLAFTPTNSANRSLLFSLFSDPSFRTLLTSMVTGTSKSHQRVPPRALKGQLVISGTPVLFRAFGEIASPWVHRAIATREESQTLASTRNTLLQKLLSGEIRVHQAEHAVTAVL